MSDQKVFCNTPWYELHIYWDGKLGICCQEDHLLYSEQETQYNIRTMSIMEWFNSEPVRRFRENILGASRISPCTRCYLEEDHGGDSRRIRSNQKSVIFTRSAFDQSYLQSPGFQHFQHSAETQGHATTWPIDLHIDLGNFCNLACKMCNSQASSTIASQQVRWGTESDRRYLGQDWTRDSETWNKFKDQLLDIPKLNNIHLMGGETLLTPRFEDLVDTFDQNQRHDVCWSFVTNGTIFRPDLIEKLKKFRRVGIEVSIECTTQHNAYTRQGTNTEEVLQNIKQYREHCNGSSITVTLRPAPSALTIGYLPTLLEYALDHQFIVKGNLCYRPEFLNPCVLPRRIRQLYRPEYQKLIERCGRSNTHKDFNTSDPNKIILVIRQFAEMCLSLLDAEDPVDQEQLLRELVLHCKKWDAVYDLDARNFYPEWKEILDQHGY